MPTNTGSHLGANRVQFATPEETLSRDGIHWTDFHMQSALLKQSTFSRYIISPGNGEAAQRLAVARFPELGKANSPLNAEFLRRYHLYRQNRPSYFQNAEWPVQLAEESAKALNSQER